MELKERIALAQDSVIAHRRWLHAHPELSGQERNTAAYIADALRDMGLEPAENLGGYGVVAVIEGRKGGKCVGLRADFDALSIQEETGLPYASETPGISHACGHDMHTAMLLGAAQVLSGMKEEFALARDTAQALLGHDCVIVPDKAAMTGEDFSFFLKEIPGAFYWLGCQKPDTPFYPLHNNRFAPDEGAMQFGMEVMLSTALSYLSE